MMVEMFSFFLRVGGGLRLFFGDGGICLMDIGYHGDSIEGVVVVALAIKVHSFCSELCIGGRLVRYQYCAVPY